METILAALGASFVQTTADVLPIAAVISLFQALAFRSLPPNPRRIALGVAFIIVGIACFRAGIDLSLIPMGSGLAERFARGVASPDESTLANTFWLIAFAGCLGFAATMIEPTLTGVAERVRDLSGGALQPLTFRLVVAAGVAAGLALGALRIVAGFPYLYLMVPLVMMIGVLALTAPRTLVPLSLDSGAMATSVVTVPIIAAFGTSLARHVPGRDALTDGFGLVLLALLTPIALLMLFAQIRLMMSGGRNGG